MIPLYWKLPQDKINCQAVINNIFLTHNQKSCPQSSPSRSLHRIVNLLPIRFFISHVYNSGGAHTEGEREKEPVQGGLNLIPDQTGSSRCCCCCRCRCWETRSHAQRKCSMLFFEGAPSCGGEYGQGMCQLGNYEKICIAVYRIKWQEKKG